ncbi:MAG: DNA polymerase III subunit gamma/tau, partial [Caulobacterales bacterium]
TARAQALGSDAKILGGKDWETRIRALAVSVSPAQLSRLWQMLLRALEEAQRAPDPIAAAEMAMVRLCAAQNLPPPEEAARLLREGPRAGASAPSGATPARPNPGATVNAAPQQHHEPETLLRSFDDVLALVASLRDIDLEVSLERYVRLTKFSPGEIVFQPVTGMPEDLPRRLHLAIKEAAGEIWTIRADGASGVESLAERRQKERFKALEDLKQHPFVAEALKKFPGAEITNVTQAPESGPAEGEIVPLRKKENER